MSTDLRSALREACDLAQHIASIPEADDERVAEAVREVAVLRALADAPLTVASLTEGADGRVSEHHAETHPDAFSDRTVLCDVCKVEGRRQRLLDTGGKGVTAPERAVIESHTDAQIAADADCEAHRVDWRARCLAAEAEVACLKPVVQAAGDVVDIRRARRSDRKVYRAMYAAVDAMREGRKT